MTRHVGIWAYSIEKSKLNILSPLRNFGRGKNYLSWTLRLPDYWKDGHYGAEGAGPLFYDHDPTVGDDDREMIAFQNVVHFFPHTTSLYCAMDTTSLIRLQVV